MSAKLLECPSPTPPLSHSPPPDSDAAPAPKRPGPSRGRHNKPWKSASELNERLPKISTPSKRNLDIYAEVEGDGLTQVEVARKHNIKQSQVSRTVAQVRKWVAQTGGDREGFSPREKIRVATFLEQRRLETLWRDTKEAMHLAIQPYESHRTRKSKGEVWTATLVRTDPPRVGFLNVEYRAIVRKGKLAGTDCGLQNADWRK